MRQEARQCLVCLHRSYTTGARLGYSLNPESVDKQTYLGQGFFGQLHVLGVQPRLQSLEKQLIILDLPRKVP